MRNRNTQCENENLGTSQNTRQILLLFYDYDLINKIYKDKTDYNLYKNPLPYILSKGEESLPGLVLRYCTMFQAPACNPVPTTLTSLGTLWMDQTCHMQKCQCTFHLSLTKSTAGIEFSIQNYSINYVPHTSTITFA